MKKLILISALSMFGSTVVHADHFLDFAQLMVDLNQVTVKDVHDGVHRYQTNLKGIAANAKNHNVSGKVRRAIILRELNLLEKSLDADFGYIASSFRPLIASDLTNYINLARIYAQDNRFNDVATLMKNAEKKLEKMKKVQ